MEIGIEGPEGNPDIINKKRDEIVKLLVSHRFSYFYYTHHFDISNISCEIKDELEKQL